MYKRTNREDWLNRALSNSNFFVSGIPDTSRKYIATGTLTLRFIGHFPPSIQPSAALTPAERALWLPPYYQIMMGFLAVEMSTQAAVNNFAPTASLLALKDEISQEFKVPVAIVAFPTEATSTGIGQYFWALDIELGISGLIDPYEYAREINRRRNPVTGDDPKVKSINKNINDYFQRWSRAYLTGQISINDVDAYKKTNAGIILCELKRSGISLNDWKPYLDDVPNYLLAKSCALKCQCAIDVTIHYSLSTEKMFGLHFVTDISKAELVGFKRVFQNNHNIGLLKDFESFIQNLLDKGYNAVNRSFNAEFTSRFEQYIQEYASRYVSRNRLSR